MWILRGSAEEQTEQKKDAWTFRLSPGATRTMGRAAGAQFIVEATMVSRLHCQLTATRKGELVVEDLDSTNGTFVNDRRIERTALVSGDRLRLGRVVEFIVLWDDGEF